MPRISEGAVPPLSLLQADGSRFELSPLLGRERILVAFSPGHSWLREAASRQEALREAASRQEALREAASRQEALRDYELRVLAILPPQVLADAPEGAGWLRLGSVGAEVLAAYGVRDGESAAFLVGRDRGVKAVYTGEANLDEVLSLIDTMPMRQEEVRQAEVARREG